MNTCKKSSKSSAKGSDINFEDCHKYKMNCFECSRSGIKNKVFYDEVEYQQHHFEQHESRNNNKKNKLICSECGKESQSWYNFAAHITIHRDHCSPPWICTMSKKSSISGEICGKTCSTRHNLMKHLEGFHRYNVIYKKRNPVQYRKKYKAKSSESVSLKESSSNNKKLKQEKPKKPTKKLRPKMRFVATPKLTSMKRSRDDELDSIYNDDVFINQPQCKKRRIAENNDNINEQVRFLNLMYKAAIHLNEEMNIINLPQIDYQPTHQQQQHVFIPMIQHQFPFNPTFSPINSSSSLLTPSPASSISPDITHL